MSVVKHSQPYLYGFLFAVSPFSPDRTFIFDVITRLEAGVGVQIMSSQPCVVSELASHVSELASLSASPGPHTQSKEQVKELISQWCAGVSSVSPTWKNLLEVISVGLPELRVQIEAFMRG